MTHTEQIQRYNHRLNAIRQQIYDLRKEQAYDSAVLYTLKEHQHLLQDSLSAIAAEGR